MYRVGIRQGLRASHFLVGDFGQECTPHAHDYRIDWIFECSGLDENGFAIDIAAMERAFREVRGELEGRLLNDLEFFEERQPSVEGLAEYLASTLVTLLGEEIVLERVTRCEVRVWESDSAWAAYVEENPVAPRPRAKAAGAKRGRATPKKRAPGSRSRS